MADSAFKILNGVLKKYRGHETCVTVPEGVREIGSSAFRGRELRELHLPDSLEKISECAFYGCVRLTELVLPRNTDSLGAGSFIGCEALRSIVFPEYLRRIGCAAFEGCRSLKKVELPEWTDDVGEFAFKGCGGIELTAPGLLEIDHAVCDRDAVLIAPAPFDACCEAALFPRTLGYCRLLSLGGEQDEGFTEYLRQNRSDFMLAAENNRDVLAALCAEKLLCREDTDKLLARLAESGNAASAGLLMEYKSGNFTREDPFAEFEL